MARQQPLQKQPQDVLDANQKRRRHRGGRARRVLWRWAQQNPALAVLLTVFCSLCLICMTLEQFFSSAGGDLGDKLFVRNRMKRAKALLRQERLQHGEIELEAQVEAQLEEEEDNKRNNKRRGGGGGWMDMIKGGNSREASPEDNRRHPKRYTSSLAHDLLDTLDRDIVGNKDGGIRWVAPYLLLPPLAMDLESRQLQQNDDQEMTRGQTRKDAVNPHQVDTKSEFFRVNRGTTMDWDDEYDQLLAKEEQQQQQQSSSSIFKPPVDYVTHPYDYPPIPPQGVELPDLNQQDEYPDYPPMKTLGQMMKDWPQDLDWPHAAQATPIPEGLYHFNYSNPQELEMARKFRDAELPFKLYDVPEVTAATLKWTDEYVSENFDGGGLFRGGGGGNRKHHDKGFVDTLFGRGTNGYDDASRNKYSSPPPRASGMCQESPNNFFAFFQPTLWDVKTMGLPPVRNNDWTFEHWSQHARYADATALNASKPHFYWQSGIPKEERNRPTSEWTFISRDLPSWSSPTETFFVFNPESQKGIQCRFGERGVVAATHYDSGRNMIAMVTGAKRYILAPPKECPKLGIVPWKFNAVFRHSLLNFGHINYMDNQPTATEREERELDDGEEEEEKGKHRTWSGERMSRVEKEWLETAASSKAIETVLKAGEVLYIPSHWFHYIVSLQKSAQCNVRSGVDDEGTPAFGGKMDVKTCGRLSPHQVQ